MATTNIEWTKSDDGTKGKTWNPIRGCTKVSEGCRNCYAMKQAHRFSGKGQAYEGLTKLGPHGPEWTGRVTLVPEMLDAPLRWKKPALVFVNSMSDLFHPDVPDEFIAEVWWVMGQCVGLLDPTRYRGHTFQILTKRPDRMRDWLRGWCDPKKRQQWIEAMGEVYDWLSGPKYWPDILPGVWLGTSVEDQYSADKRIPYLLQTPAVLRWVSYEPALSSVDFTPYLQDQNTGHIHVDMVKLDWIVVGGESGPGARPFDIEWARSTIRQCKAAGIAVFTKQLGSKPFGGEKSFIPEVIPFKDWGKGGNPEHWPEDLRVREWPK